MGFLQIRTIYLKMTLWIVCLCTLLIVPISLFLSHKFSDFATSEINQFTQSKMKSSIENIDFIFERMRFHSLRMYVDDRTQDYLSLKVHHGGKLWEAYTSIMNNLINEPFIHSVYMINKDTNVVFDSKSGIFDFLTFKDQQMLRLIESGEMESLTYFNHQIEDEDYLAMIVNAKQYHGTLVTILDKEKLQKYLLQDGANEDYRVYLIDSEHNLLLGDESWYELEDLLLQRSDGNKGQYIASVNHVKWSVNAMKLEQSGWTLYHLTDMSAWSKAVSNFQRNILYSSAIILGVIFMIVLWQSRRTYRPFSQLAKRIETNLKSVGTKEEFQPQGEHQVLSDGFDALMRMINQMNASMREHKHIIKEEKLRQWILQGYLNQPLQEYVRDNTRLLEYERLLLAVVRIDRYQVFLEKYDLNSRNAMKFAIGNIAEYSVEDQQYAVQFADFGGDHLVILIGANDSNVAAISDFLEDLQNQVKKWLKLDITIAVSDPRSAYDNLRFTYHDIYDLSTLKFITGDEKIYRESDAEQYLTFTTSMDSELHKIQDSLIQAVRLGHPNKVNDALDQLFNEMQKMSFADCKFHLTIILYAFIKSFSQLTQLNSFKGIEQKLGQFTTLHEVKEWLGHELEQVMQNLEQRKSSDRKSELAREIEEYISIHIHDPMLSVQQIADHLSLSPNYVRQIFKEVKGESLSEFILSTRLQNVKELLTSTDWLISEIAERSGFQTKSNFYTVFKKMVGMTPLEYRQQYKDETK